MLSIDIFYREICQWTCQCLVSIVVIMVTKTKWWCHNSNPNTTTKICLPKINTITRCIGIPTLDQALGIREPGLRLAGGKKWDIPTEGLGFKTLITAKEVSMRRLRFKDRWNPIQWRYNKHIHIWETMDRTHKKLLITYYRWHQLIPPSIQCRYHCLRTDQHHTRYLQGRHTIICNWTKW